MKRFPFPLRYSIPIILILCGSSLGIFSFFQEIRQIYQDTENKARNYLKISAGQTAIIIDYLYRRKDTENAVITIISQLGSDPNLDKIILLDENNIITVSNKYSLIGTRVENIIGENYLASFTNVRNKRQGQILKSEKEQYLTAIYPILLETLPNEIQPSRIGILLFEYNLSEDRKQAYQDALRRNFISSLLLALFCLTLWFFFEFNLNHRVFKLVIASNHFAEGNLNIRTKLSGSDELATISAAFDHMASKIQENTIILKKELAHKKIITKELQETNKQLRLATRAKSEFLANMSHEIRTPMNGVIAIAELLALTDLDQEQKEFVNIIQDSGITLVTIINDILHFSKSEAGKIQLENYSFSLIDLVKSTCILFKKQAQTKQIEIKYNLDPDIPNNIMGDPSRLRQIFLNLIGNALKFTNSGYILISIEIKNKVTIDSNKQQSRYIFLVSIKDTGIGIDEVHLQKLFKPFSQGDSSINRKYGGTGLGLTISKNLVELMGGNIWVESRGNFAGKTSENWLINSLVNDQGSTFYFTFKATDVSSSDLKQPKYLEENLTQDFIYDDKNNLKILLAEDNKVNQKVALLTLKKIGYEADVANNGVEVLDMLKNKYYDVILMDMQMPEMDGLSVTRVIRETFDYQPYIIALTANILEEDRQKCLDVGMDDYMSKPISSNILKEVLNRVI